MDEDGLVTPPEPRIGDAERDDAATLLQEMVHYFSDLYVPQD